MRKKPRNSIVPALASLSPIRVSMRIHNPVHAPDCTDNRCRERVPQSRNEHRTERSGVVLVEVLVGALCGVECEHSLGCRRAGGLDLFVGRIFVGVGDFGGFAEGADAHALVEACEEGGDGGEEDVAVEGELV